MDNNKIKKHFEKLLAQTGIEFNGNKPWDIKVHNDKLYRRVLAEGSVGFGEAYMDGWWDSEKIDEMFTRLLKSKVEDKIKINASLVFSALNAKILNKQSKKRAFQVGEEHYDLGNDIYENMLDKRMIYTCGYWKDTNDLDKAQENKLNLVCLKLNLKKGDKILDIGCGWGGFAKFATQKYGVEVVGITVSREQVDLCKNTCHNLPVEIKLQDYRDLNEKFDHIVSLGMFEHVGPKNYNEYMKVAHRCLKDDGLFLLHTIGGNRSVKNIDPWIEKYIFPNSVLPSIKQIGESIENLFVMEDWHNFGEDYDKTLMAWFENFNNNWPKLKNKYGERFYRMWKYYILSCAGSFRARKNQLWQIVLSKNGVSGGYKPIR